MWWGMKWFLLPPSTPLLLAIPSPKVTDQTKTENRTIFSYCIFACFIYTSTRRSQHHQERQQADCFIPLIVWFLRIGYFWSCTTWKDMGLLLFFFSYSCNTLLHGNLWAFLLLFIFFFWKKPTTFFLAFSFIFFCYKHSHTLFYNIKSDGSCHRSARLGWSTFFYLQCCCKYKVFSSSFPQF